MDHLPLLSPNSGVRAARQWRRGGMASGRHYHACGATSMSNFQACRQSGMARRPWEFVRAMMSWPSVRDRPDGCCQQTVSYGAAFIDVHARFNAMERNSISYVISTNYIGFLQFDYESLFASTISMCVCILQGCDNNVGFMPNLQISWWLCPTGHDG